MPDTLSLAEHMFQDVPIEPEIIDSLVTDDTLVLPDTILGNEPDQIFIKAHSGGQEFSGTLEQARKLCPVLGQMSVENARATLQEEDLAARMLQAGREKRLAEAANENEARLHLDKPTNPEKDSYGAKQIEESVINRIEEATLAEIEHRQAFEAVEQDNSPAEVVIIRGNEDKQAKPTVLATHNLVPRRTDPVRPPKSKSSKQVRPEGDKPKESKETERISLADKIEYTPDNQAQDVSKKPERTILEVLEPNDELAPEPIADEKTVDPLPLEATSSFDEPESSVPGVAVAISHAQAPLELAERPDIVISEADPEQEVGLTNYDTVEGDEAIPLVAEFDYSENEDEIEIFEAKDSLAIEAAVVGPADEYAKTESNDIEQIVPTLELPASHEYIESAITKLAVTLESAEAEYTKKVHQILQQIIMLPNSLEPGIKGEENVDVEQRLTELFVELFEHVGIEYTPELIESFVKLTEDHYLRELLPMVIESKGDAQTLSDKIGTREFLHKLQHGLGAMKQVAAHFYEIGKSVMRMYAIHYENVVII